MTARAGVAAAVAGLTFLAPVAPAGGAGASGPIEEAREAARRTPFSARVEVSWVDSSGLHTAELGVLAVGGNIRIQGPGGTTGDATAVMLDAPPAPGAEAAGLLTPALERKYELVRSGTIDVAGRRTDLIVLRSDGRVRERLAIDKATGLVLQREVFGPEGRPVRVVKVLQLDTAPVPHTVGGARRADRPRQLRVSGLPAPYRAPAMLAGGYQRVAAYRHDRMVHLLYTDGLHGLSLFSQPGELVAGALPTGGEPVRVGAADGVRYTWPGGEVVTWQTGSMVHTLVGDGPADDLLGAARSVPRPGRQSLLGRLRSTSRLVAELISGGR